MEEQMLQTAEATPNQFGDVEEVHIVVISADCVVSEFIIVSILYTVYYKSYSFMVFAVWPVTAKYFQWNSLCNRPWPCKTIVQLRKISSELTAV